MADKLREKQIYIKQNIILGFLLTNKKNMCREKRTVPRVVCNLHSNSSEIYRNLEIYLHKMGDSAKHIAI